MEPAEKPKKTKSKIAIVLIFILGTLVWLAAISTLITAYTLKDHFPEQIGNILAIITMPIVTQLIGFLFKWWHYKKVGKKVKEFDQKLEDWEDKNRPKPTRLF